MLIFRWLWCLYDFFPSDDIDAWGESLRGGARSDGCTYAAAVEGVDVGWAAVGGRGNGGLVDGSLIATLTIVSFHHGVDKILLVEFGLGA